jgi:hypothetical protein
VYSRFLERQDKPIVKTCAGRRTTTVIPQWENLNHLFCRKVSFLTAPHCQFRGVSQGMKENLSFNNNYIT